MHAQLKKLFCDDYQIEAKWQRHLKQKRISFGISKLEDFFPKLEPRIDVVMSIMFLQSSIRHKLS